MARRRIGQQQGTASITGSNGGTTTARGRTRRRTRSRRTVGAGLGGTPNLSGMSAHDAYLLGHRTGFNDGCQVSGHKVSGGQLGRTITR